MHTQDSTGVWKYIVLQGVWWKPRTASATIKNSLGSISGPSLYLWHGNPTICWSFTCSLHCRFCCVCISSWIRNLSFIPMILISSSALLPFGVPPQRPFPRRFLSPRRPLKTWRTPAQPTYISWVWRQGHGLKYARRCHLQRLDEFADVADRSHHLILYSNWHFCLAVSPHCTCHYCVQSHSNWQCEGYELVIIVHGTDRHYCFLLHV